MSLHITGLFVILFPTFVHAQAATPTADQILFGKQFADRIAARQQAAAVSMFDEQEIFDQAQANIAAPADFKNGIRNAFSGQFAAPLVKTFITVARQGYTFKFIHCLKHGTEWEAVYRKQKQGDLSVDYYEFLLKTDAAGKQHFADVYTLSQGTRVSESIRRLYLDAVIKNDKTSLEKIGDKERVYIENQSGIQKMMQNVTKAQYQDALDICKTLPESVQHDRTVLHLKIVCLDQIGDRMAGEYKAALQDCRKYCPDDPSLDFMAVTYLSKQKQFKQAHEAVDRLIAYYGEDGNWDFWQANMFALSGEKQDRNSAMIEFRKAIAAEPDFEPPYWSLIFMDIQNKDYADVTTLLSAFKRNTGKHIGDLTKIAAYAGFVKSPEGKAWMAEQSKTAPAAEP